MPAPDADPHGSVDFDELNNPNFIDMPANKRSDGNRDEMI